MTHQMPSEPVEGTRPRREPGSPAPRGQILVLFVMMLTILLGMAAFVVDMAWIWTNQLKVQRAADAAALAGVVHLPDEVPLAISDAHAEARKNEYPHGTGGVVVTPRQDPANARRMHVVIRAPIETFFMGLFGFDTVTITRQAKAEYVLPVPMGSPQNYYGVGDFRYIGPGASGNTGAPLAPTGTTAPNGWANPTGAYIVAGTTASDADGEYQAYRNFNLTVPNGFTVLGIEVVARARSTDNAGCRLGVSLSWKMSGTANSDFTPNPERVQNLTDVLTNYTIGGPADTWGRTWSSSELSNANFRVRVHDVDPGSACVDTATTHLDHLTVKVYYQAPAVDTLGSVASPTGGTLTSQGFWGAVFTKGGVRQNGDRYAPAHWSSGSTAANPDHDPGGYDYTIEIGANGSVSLYDAPFCGTGQTSFGGWYGAGDHWTGRPSGGGNGIGPVTTRYRLYDTLGTEYVTTDDVMRAEAVFANEFQTNQSGAFGTPQRSAADGAANCANPVVEPFHNAWYPLGTNLAAGTYRLNVSTSDSANNTIAAENLFSVHVSGGLKPRVYGSGRMAAYTNLEAGLQTFYLAQIEDVHAGKILDITLFDPGDVSGDAFLRILSPDGNSYDYAVFDYVADAQCTTASDACSASNRTQIKTHGSGGSSFDNSVLQISIDLPTTYGQGGLTPPGETEPGWWKIEYNVAGGNDTTTWEVAIRGNPVRLVVP